MADAVNPDLARERRNATFDVENLTNFIYGGAENVRRKRYLQNLAANDPIISQSKPWAFQTREEEYNIAVMKNVHLHKRAREMGITDPTEKAFYLEAGVPNQNSPFGVNWGMFIPSIKKMGTKEQKEKWLPKAERLEMIGTYAQTEIGHGTFIRGLETTATYDPSSKEFVLNSPTVSSLKYWPAALGRTANHCLVMAQLYTGGKHCGLHMFMVQLRNMKTHAVLPGIECGDIGTKFGFGSTDNGYLRLTNVRIPRTNMLMSYAQVLENGTFIPSKTSRIEYGTMVLVRTRIIVLSSTALSQACTIAIRYSAVRRQTEVSPGGEEAQVLDYQTQQYKLFPYLATAYAYYFVGQFIKKYYTDVMLEIESGKMDSIVQLHAVCAGLKAYCSWTMAEGIEVCRLCCGGHGYSHASGIPKIYVNSVVAVTAEGENNVMILQNARHLMKVYRGMLAGRRLGAFEEYLVRYLNEESNINEALDVKCLLRAYEHRSTRLLKNAVDKLQKVVSMGKTEQEAWNSCTVAFTWAAKAHCHAFVMKAFTESVISAEMDERIRNVLMTLCKLYAVHGIVENLGDFIQDRFFNSEQVEMLQRKLTDLLEEVRPNAVALVDAFDYPDVVLDSCLGRYDGQVYQALYDYAKRSPLNEKEVLPTYEKYIKPIQRGQQLPFEVSKL